jgi:SulP family sulfate permease
VTHLNVKGYNENQFLMRQKESAMNASDLKKSFQLSTLLPILSAGSINAVIMISVELSFAALIFSGDLQQFLPRGIGIMLLGAACISIIISLTSSLVGMVGVPQDTPAALMALVAAGIAATLKGQDPEVIYSTAVGAIMFTSLLTAIIFILLGWFKASSFVRYVPYPVVGGFLTGTGYLLTKGAMGVMVDVPLTVSNFSKFFSANILASWLPGILFGLTLFFVLRRYNHFLIMPGAVLIAIAFFYAYVFAAGISIENASANGWLLGPFPEGGLFHVFTPDNFAMVQWSAVFMHFDTFATLFGLSVISLLLNASGLEVVYKKDIDLDRELIAAGGATLVGGLAGCIVGYQTLGLSALVKRFDVNSRLVGVLTGLLCGLALFFGASVLSFFPRFVLGGMLFMLGLSFMAEWLVDYYKLLPRMDYLLIWVMLFIIQMFGFLQAIGAGIVIAALLFVFSYGSTDVIKSIWSGDSFHSQIVRPKRHKKAFTEKGAQIYILRLQGYIFFGSIQRVLQNIRDRIVLKDAQPLKYLVLDFKGVNRLDSSAVFGLARLKQTIDANDIAMIWTNLSDEVRSQMANGGLLKAEGDTFSIQSTLDYGVEWCENKLLAREIKANKIDFVDSVLSYMSHSFPGLDRVKKYIEQETIRTGEYLIKQGDASNDLFFIESGLVTVEFEASNGRRTRLRSVQSGATVGEIGLYLGGLRSASVRAEETSTFYRLTTKTLNKIQQEDPAVAASLHEWLGHLLAERLADNNRIIELLLD